MLTLKWPQFILVTSTTVSFMGTGNSKVLHPGVRHVGKIENSELHPKTTPLTTISADGIDTLALLPHRRQERVKACCTAPSLNPSMKPQKNKARPKRPQFFLPGLLKVELLPGHWCAWNRRRIDPPQQSMHLAKQEGAGALPPECRETAPKMAHSVMVELSLKGEE